MIPRRAISVLSLVRDKHFQEQDYMENQKTFLYSPRELYLSKMVLYMSSREFRSLLSWCTIGGTQKDGSFIAVLILCQEMIRLQNFMKALLII